MTDGDSMLRHARVQSNGEMLAGDGNFPVIGIGASAGGLRPLQAFLAHTPADAEMAFVVIVHPAPEYTENLRALLQSCTPMPVAEAPAARLAPNHVYLIPAGQELVIDGDQLDLLPLGGAAELHAPIDLLFRTLAETYDWRAGAVVLSGMGSDGASGLARVKERGGVSIVQAPGEATFDQMPRAAIDTGLVDFVLQSAAMPAALISYWHNADLLRLPDPDPAHGEPVSDLYRIFAVLRARAGHDFSQYKRPTMLRRLGRRMQVMGAADLPAYLAILHEHPQEVEALLRDLLIGVTNFFRDPEAWQAIEALVPRLFAGKSAGDQLRVWVAGCASGEEAYSLAMLLLDYARTLDRPPSIQVLATDIDEPAIARARRGVYGDTIVADVPSHYLAHFFTLEQDHYRVTPDLRDAVIFAVHNLLRDPPFSQLELITCRNVLIYLDRTAQEQVLNLFHFSLRADGYLLLGSSETADVVPQRFKPLDSSQRLYQRRSLPLATPATLPPPRINLPRLHRPRAHDHAADGPRTLSDLNVHLLAQYGPPTVIVDEHYDIMYLSRGAGRFFELGEGELSANLLALIHPSVRLNLRTALRAAAQHSMPSHVSPLRMDVDGTPRLITIVVQPIGEPEWARGALLVLFNDLSAAEGVEQAPANDADSLVRQLEEEVLRLREQLRVTSEQYTIVVEEYKASNEELQVVNEEQRATTEELEASKEELQSINEELLTLNQELKHKINEVSQSNDDLRNLMDATAIGTVFVDRQLRITRYTPAALAIFNLIPADLHRQLSHITHTLEDDQLAHDVERVLQTLQPIEREVRSRNQQRYLARFQPYRTYDHRIDGVVLTFVDITERKAG